MSQDDDGDDFFVQEDDAVIILRADGGIDSYLPDAKEDIVRPGSAMLQAAVILYILNDEKRYRAIEEEFLGLCEEPENEMLH